MKHKRKVEDPITSKQAAMILKKAKIPCSEYKITRWCRENKFQSARKVGGQWYVSEAEIRGLVEVEDGGVE